MVRGSSSSSYRLATVVEEHCSKITQSLLHVMRAYLTIYLPHESEAVAFFSDVQFADYVLYQRQTWAVDKWVQAI